MTWTLFSRHRARGPVLRNVVVNEDESWYCLQMIGFFKQGLDLSREQFLTENIRFFLHDLGERNLQATRKVKIQRPLNDPSDTSFATLRINADNRLVAPADIMRIKRQIWYLPVIRFGGLGGFTDLEPFFDGILVRTAKGADDELATIWGAWMNRDLVGLLDNVDDSIDVGKVDFGVNTLGVEVQRQSDEVDVPGSFAISEKGAFDAVCAGHLSKLSSSDCATTVIMRMKGYAEFFSLGHAGAKVLDLVSIDVRSRDFHGGGKIEYDWV